MSADAVAIHGLYCSLNGSSPTYHCRHDTQFSKAIAVRARVSTWSLSSGNVQAGYRREDYPVIGRRAKLAVERSETVPLGV